MQITGHPILALVRAFALFLRLKYGVQYECLI